MVWGGGEGGGRRSEKAVKTFCNIVRCIVSVLGFLFISVPIRAGNVSCWDERLGGTLRSDPAPQNKFLVFKLIRYVVHTLAVNFSPDVIKVWMNLGV